MRRPRPWAVAATLVAAGVVVTGCSNPPTAAAVVEGSPISISTLDQAVTGANQILASSGQELSKDQVLSVLIQGAVAEHLAEQRGQTITDAQRDAKLSAAALSVPAARSFVYDVADSSIMSETLGEKEFVRQLAAAKVNVNPRYGTWTAGQSASVTAGNGSLSQVLQSSS